MVVCKNCVQVYCLFVVKVCLLYRSVALLIVVVTVVLFYLVLSALEWNKWFKILHFFNIGMLYNLQNDFSILYVHIVKESKEYVWECFIFKVNNCS